MTTIDDAICTLMLSSFMKCSKCLHRFNKRDKENTIPIHRQGSECEKKVPKNEVFHNGPIFILLDSNKY